MFSDYDADMCAWSTVWPQRRAMEEYRAWLSARKMLKEPHSVKAWNLVVESAYHWLQKDREPIKSTRP